MGFSINDKRIIVNALRKLRREKRQRGTRLSFQDVEQLIWYLPPSFLERLNDSLSKWQGKKVKCTQ